MLTNARTLLQTKGREAIDIACKDRAATIWSENPTLLTGTLWEYLKIPQPEFGRLQPTTYSDLCALQPATLLF